MGTESRDRKKANRAAKLAAEEKAAKRKKTIRLIRNVVIFAVFILVLLLILGGCSSDEKSSGDQYTNGDNIPAGQTDDTDSATPKDYGSTACPAVDAAKKPTIDFDDSFKKCIDESKTYTALVKTTEGDVTIELDAAGHPITTNNFVALARSGYYDGTDLFRTESNTGIIQGGSPHTQSAADPGPGFTIVDEGAAATADDYGPGTLAMARTSAPNSASAQFFLLAGEGGRYLGDPSMLGPNAGSYRVFGKTTKGLDVLEKIAALDNGNQEPSKPASIETVTITES